MRTVDLFGGPGGWDVAAHSLGLEPLGIEWDDAACATRLAAGLDTLQADVAEVDPADHPCGLLIASPPCPTFSTAGDRAGGLVLTAILGCLAALAKGRDDRHRYRHQAEEILLPTAKSPERARRDAAMSLLVVEPLRWVTANRPRRVALEQVPPVLEIWERLAEILRGLGYQTWTGILSSEQFGVPQTRARAILMASLDGPVTPPAPTHQRFVPMPKLPPQDSLFEMPRQRIVHPGDERLLPWVSMADALGWGMIAKPYPTIASGRKTGGPDREKVGGSSAREVIYDEKAAGRWIIQTRGEDGSRDCDTYDGGESPSRVVTGKTYSWLVHGNQENATERAADEPAATLVFGHDMNEVKFVRRERSGDRSEEGFDPDGTPSQAVTTKARSWTVRTNNFSAQARDPDGARRKAGSVPYERPVDEPAPTLDTNAHGWSVNPDDDDQDWPRERPAPTLLSTHRSDAGGIVGRQLAPGDGRNVGGKNWTDRRPSTTVTGDPRIAQPGHKKDRDFPDAPRRQEDAVRITIAEASILQSFPPDYPWQGSRTKQFEQCGNAVPPLLARAVLEALLS